MSASPVLIERPQAREIVPQTVIDALMSFVRERAIGSLEIHFNSGGVGIVIAKKNMTEPASIIDQTRNADTVPQKVIDAFMSFVRERATGLLEIQFASDGIGNVIAKKSQVYK